MTAQPLTRTDLAALRRADQICFDHGATRGDARVHQIRAFKQVKDDPWQGEKVYTVEVASAVASYSDDRAAEWRCFEMIHTAQYHRAWRTVVGLLRTGDVITLRWTAQNNNEHANLSGLVLDELELDVVRGKRTLTFAIETRLCAHDSARMCQPQHVSYSLTR